MRLIDPDVELVAAGSSGPDMPTFGEWERTVLAECLPDVDHLSLHLYVEDADGTDPASLLASGDVMGRFIETVAAIADEVADRLGVARRLGLSFDEWNVWHMAEHARRTIEPWRVGPEICEDTYSGLEGVVVGSLMITLLQHSARVRIACLAQLVNVIAPIRTDERGAWRQTIFHPFADASAHLGDELLALDVDTPTHDTAKHGPAADVTAAATRHSATGRIALFCVNRTVDRAHPVDLEAPPGYRVSEAWVRRPDAAGTGLERAPLAVGPRGFELDPCSWAVVLLDPDAPAAG